MLLEKDIETFATQVGISQNELIRQSLLTFIWSKLQNIQTKIFILQKKYKIETVFDFEKLYEKGHVEEADTWEDLQEFDRLTYEQELYEKFLKRFV